MSPAALNRLARFPFAAPVIIVLAALALFVNEMVYRDTTATLRSGIALTDARIATAQVLQLLTDAETAQRGYLLTGQESYLAPLSAVKAELPASRQRLNAFLESTGPTGKSSAAHLSRAIDDRLLEIDGTVALASGGYGAAALKRVESGLGQGQMDAIRSEFAAALGNAASRQSQARVSLFDAFWISRVAVATLLLLSTAGLLLYLQFLRRQDEQREQRQRELQTLVDQRTAELRELAGHLQTAREDEKANLARELHDELGGLLTAVKLDLARLRSQLADNPVLTERLVQANRRLDEGIALKRRVIEDLRPSALDTFGLAASLSLLCQQVSSSIGKPVRAELADVDLAPEGQLAVYRLVQESLTNICKYARASQVRVQLQQHGGMIRLQISDDGVGFDPAAVLVAKHGLTGMRFRVACLGGTLAIDSLPGAGTTVVAELPAQAEALETARQGGAG